ncbi:hypothetical protein FH972_013356 [Carpinus fangiana]|uniref:Tocopherol cyclase n=1 Tax=Carpinus fangiana TaxID=176857 RepID=A0A5N6R7H0_9ROSI|nr:hypothetical protein FH972_013356 [Carpinus fangiana]
METMVYSLCEPHYFSPNFGVPSINLKSSVKLAQSSKLSSFGAQRSSPKLGFRPCPRVFASSSTVEREREKEKEGSGSVSPVYVPTPPNRELRTPHSGCIHLTLGLGVARGEQNRGLGKIQLSEDGVVKVVLKVVCKGACGDRWCLRLYAKVLAGPRKTLTVLTKGVFGNSKVFAPMGHIAIERFSSSFVSGVGGDPTISLLRDVAMHKFECGPLLRVDCCEICPKCLWKTKVGGGPPGSGRLVLGSDTVKVTGICTGQLGGPVVTRFQAVLTFLVLLVEGSMVRTVDLAGNDAVPSLCSQQVVIGPAGVSRSKVSYLETFPLSFSQLPSGVGVSGCPELPGRHELILGNTFIAEKELKPPNKEVPPQEFSKRVLEGFQVSPLWNQGFIRDDGRSNYVDTVKTARWEYSTRPTYGWGNVGSKQKSTAGWLAAFPVFEPHWQICMAGGLSTGWIEWDGERFEFQNAPSYSEKNWGGAFPRKWFWVQCNIFEGASGEVALTAAGGLRQLPGLTENFENAALVGVHYDGIFYEFVPWNGGVSWEIAPWGYWYMAGENQTHKVELEVTTKDPGTALRAPTLEAGLAPACKDSCFGELRLRIWERRYDGNKGKMILDVTSNMAAVEVGGGPWFNTWKGETSTPELISRALNVPIDVEGIFGFTPLFKPPGL